MNHVVPRLCAALLVSAGAIGAQAPSDYQAQLRAGVELDLKGQYAQARQKFEQAIAVAETPQQKDRAEHAMAVSWAFENNCSQARTTRVAYTIVR